MTASTLSAITMSVAHHRSKHPEQVRTSLLSAALDLLVDVGIQSVTLDAVAKMAKVSKGGLLHHFPNRVALIDALSDRLLDDFDARFEAVLQDEPSGPARLTRAYLKVSMADRDTRAARALALLSMFWPGCGRRCTEIQTRLASEDGPTPAIADALLLLRQAVEGFWYAQARGDIQVSEARRQSLLEHLLRQHALATAEGAASCLPQAVSHQPIPPDAPR